MSDGHRLVHLAGEARCSCGWKPTSAARQVASVNQHVTREGGHPSGRVRYGNLSRPTRALILYAGGGTVASYIRHNFPDGVWRGDACGCRDDRCIGYHHDDADDCQCLPVLLREWRPDLWGAAR